MAIAISGIYFPFGIGNASMGLLRTFFALSVVFAHSPFNQGNVLMGGRLSVQAFYVISGFLISYILNTNEAYQNPARFYQNRLLRLFPSYATVALITLAFNFIINPTFFEVYRHSPPNAGLFLILSNLFLFGQDWIMFAGIKEGLLTFTGDFMNSDVLLYKGLLAPQAWSLGVELSFYLIAPFILRSLRWVTVLFLASLGLRVVLLSLHLAQSDPWSYRFFPLELAWFLAGALSHRLLLPFWRAQIQRFHYLPEAATGLFFAYIFIHPSIVSINHNLRDSLALATFIVILPLTFLYQSRYTLDRKIGQISYPLYISHWVCLDLVQYIAQRIGVTDAAMITTCNVVLALMAAPILYWAVDNRLEKIRQRIKMGSTTIIPSPIPAHTVRA